MARFNWGRGVPAAAPARAPRFSKGGGKGGGKGKSPKESPDSIRSKNIARIIDIYSEGETGGLYDSANPLKSVYFDGTPVMNADGSLNFQGVEIEERYGLPDQDPVAGFPAVEAEIAVGTQVTFDSPVTVTITDPDVDAVRVKMRTPRLAQITSGGNIVNGYIDYAIDVQANGGSFVEVKVVNIQAKSSNAYEREDRVELPAGGAPWNVRMRRLNADSASDRNSNDSYFSSYTKVIDAKLKRPNVAYVALTADSEEFGDRIAAREYDVKGIKILVPKNYDFATRTYLTTGPGTSGGLWDGTFKREISDSHAWHVYNLLLSNRYGLGDYLGTLQPDKYAFYAMAQYSDELVSDGQGGLEPRFTCNTWISTQQQGLKLIQELLAGCWAQLVGAGGTIFPVQDRPADAAKLLAPANVIDGVFDYQGAALDERHSVFFVTFNDPENNYQPRPAAHEEPELIARYGWRPLNAERRDCTSHSEAIRHGRWLAETEKAGLDKVTAAAGYDMTRGSAIEDMVVGKITKIADPAYAGQRWGGKLKAATTSQVTLDAAVVLEPLVAYTLSAVLPDLTVEERPILTGAGTHTVIDLASPFSAAPIASGEDGAMWVISSPDVEPRQFRILGIRERAEHIFEFVGLQHDPDKYDRIFNNLTRPDRSFSAIPTGPIKAPTALAAEEFLYESGASLLSGVLIGWTKASDPRVQGFEVEAAEPGGTQFAQIASTTNVTLQLDDVAEGLWQFRVRAIDALGRPSAYTPAVSLDVRGKTAPPAPLTGFLVTVQGTTAAGKWDQHPDLDVRIGGQIVLRHTPSTGAAATWENAFEVQGGRFPGIATGGQMPILPGTYLAKAQDSSGNYSTDAVKSEVASTGVLNFNAVATRIEEPVFAGAKVNVEVVDALGDSEALLFDGIPDFDAVPDLDLYSVTARNVLTLAALGLFDEIPDLDAVTDLDGFGGYAPSGSYFFSAAVDAGALYESVRITAVIVATAVAGGATFDSRPGTIDTWDSIDGTVPGAASAALYISATEDDPASGAAAWSAYVPFVPGDYRGRGFRFRLDLATTLTDQNIQISKLQVTVDMPDRIEAGQGLTTLTTGVLRVTFAIPFFVAPANAVTPIAMGETERLVLSSEDATGFSVEILSSGGSRLARNFNYVSKGAGTRLS